MKDATVRHYAQRAQIALDWIDRHAKPRQEGPVQAEALQWQIEELRKMLCKLAGASTLQAEIDEDRNSPDTILAHKSIARTET